MPDVTVDPDALLSRCATEGLGLRIPAPLNRVLNAACERLEDEGAGRVEKHELLAALLTRVFRDLELADIADLIPDLSAYRLTRAHSIMPGVSAGDAPVVLSAVARGRRPRRT